VQRARWLCSQRQSCAARAVQARGRQGVEDDVRARGRQVQWYRHNVNRRDLKHRHNDSNAAVLTKMRCKKRSAIAGGRCGPSYIDISRRVRSRVLKGVGWGLSSRDFHFRIPVVRFRSETMSNHECVSDDLRVTSVRSPPALHTRHTVSRVFTSSPLHANVYLRMRREGERSNATHLPRARLVRAPRVYSV